MYRKGILYVSKISLIDVHCAANASRFGFGEAGRKASDNAVACEHTSDTGKEKGPSAVLVDLDGSCDGKDHVGGS